MGIQAQSIIIDITDNHGAANRIGFRQIRFYNQGVHHGNITWQELATSEFSSNFHAENLFITGYITTDTSWDFSWIAADPNNANQRVIGNFYGDGYEIDEIRIFNYHDSGGDTNFGINNIKIYVRHNDDHTDTTFDAAIPDSTLIFDGSIPEHVASDVEDEQVLTLINLPAPTWDVIYEGNGEHFGTAPATVVYEESATVTISDNTGTLGKIGYEFAGWNTQADGLGTHFDAADTFAMPTNDITLYAEWATATGDDMMKSIIIDIADNWGDPDLLGLRQVDIWNQGQKQRMPGWVAFDAYRTSSASFDVNVQWAFLTETETMGETTKVGDSSYNAWYTNSDNTNQRLIFVFPNPIPFQEIRINNFHHEGNFTSWGAKNVKIHISSDAISDTTYDAAIPNSTLIFDGVLDQHVDSDVEDEQVLTLINMTTYYSVAYDGNTADSGTPPTDDLVYEGGQAVTVLGQSDLVKANFVFGGWNTASDGSGTSYNESDTFSMPGSDVTLYAQWATVVTYDGNGNTSGTVPIDSTKYYTGDDATVLGQSDLAKTLNYFNAWNTAADGTGTSYAENDTIAMGTANVTLYAQWALSTIYGDIALKIALPIISGLASVPQIGFGRIRPGRPTIKATAGGHGKIEVDLPTISGSGVVKNIGHISMSPQRPEVKLFGYSAIIGIGKIQIDVCKISGAAVVPSLMDGQIQTGEPTIKGVGVVGVIGTGGISLDPPRVHGFSEVPKMHKIIKYNDSRSCS